MPVPDDVPWAEAGGFPEAFTTAHDALFTQCGLAMGERCGARRRRRRRHRRACSWRPPWRAGGGDRAQPGPARRCRRARRRRGDRSRRVRRPAGRSTWSSSSSARRTSAGDLRALDTGGRIAVIGVGAGGSRRGRLARAHGRAAAASMASTLRARAWRTRRWRAGSRGARDPVAGRRSHPRARAGDVPGGTRQPTPMSASRRAASSARSSSRSETVAHPAQDRRERLGVTRLEGGGEVAPHARRMGGPGPPERRGRRASARRRTRARRTRTPRERRSRRRPCGPPAG